MRGYRISEAAALSGLSRSSLRFYEKAGVLRQPARTRGGYREYTGDDLDRLRFLARTKDLGLGLDEVRDLLTVWDGGTCASAQARLRDLVAAKIEKVDQRVAELGRLRAELRSARDALTGPATSGGCSADCSCMSATDVSRPALACALGPADLQDRVDEWHSVLEYAQGRSAVADGVQVLLPADPALTARVARLVALEQQCCSFLEFTLAVGAPGRLLLTVTSPPEALPLVQELLGV